MSPVTTGTTTLTTTVRFYAAARAAAGTETTTVDLPEGATVEDLLDTLRAAHDAEFTRVLLRCSYLLDEVAVRDTSVVVHDGAVLDVLPPFAGG
ncbi:MAG: MoaD/ThiS family protein [Pseudonocardiaceae bacterium]|nr:MAG: MoaD/ThiS family protein [Pseudonocardiaceae bacterium]